MSTRRARIKAVTSLPPRRKNAETASNNNKAKAQKEISDKPIKSPRTPKRRPSVVSNNEQNLTPNSKNSEQTGRTTPRRSRTPIQVGRLTPLRLTSNASPHFEQATLTGEKPQANENSNKNTVFASPLRKDSPRATFASPYAPSPKPYKIVEVQKAVTPQKKIITPIAQKINENNELQITESVIKKVNHNAKVTKNQTEISENVNDEAMDGIVPLQPASTVHKPIDLLKNEIISENAEVLFDPIVPLPSPSKVRPKLKPVPRLGPHRRNSVQGSASESEDESRRLASASRQRHDSHTSQSTHMSLPNRDVSRVRNDSVCSGVSQIAQPLVTESMLKEKKDVKTKRQGATRRVRRRRENVKRDTMTMYDLIFYNPTSNPIVPDEDEIGRQEANKEELEKSKKNEAEKSKKIETTEPEPSNAPVPQIKLGPQGEIILDESSLVINQTKSTREVSSVVYEGAWSSGNGYKSKRAPRTAEWSAPETIRFYRALAAIGTDFTLMAPLFPDRTRRDLKTKFKKEERLNGAQVDKALRTKVPWNALKLKDEFKEERIAAAKRQEQDKQRMLIEKKAERERLKSARELRVRQSKGAKALESTMLPGMTEQQPDVVTAEDIIERLKRTKAQQKEKKTVVQKVPIRMHEQIPTVTLTPQKTQNDTDMATLTKTPNWKNKTPIHKTSFENRTHVVRTPDVINGIPQIPPNIESGSLVVLTVNDPMSPSKKMLQTYIADGSGNLEPVALPSVLLNSVVGYMKKNTPKSSYTQSPQLMSPTSITSQDSRTSTPSIIVPSPSKRRRNNSFTITQL